MKLTKNPSSELIQKLNDLDTLLTLIISFDQSIKENWELSKRENKRILTKNGIDYSVGVNPHGFIIKRFPFTKPEDNILYGANSKKLIDTLMDKL